MLRFLVSAFAVAALLSGCSGGSRTVDKPIDEVRAIVQAAETSIGMTNYLMPGAGHRTELLGDGLVWHFTFHDQDYARMKVSLAAKDAQSTKVTSAYEKAGEAVGPGVPFLQDTAKSLSEEILTAALEGRPLDTTALATKYKIQAASNPMAVAGAARGYMDEAARTMKEMNSPSSGGYSSEPYDKVQPYDRTPAYDKK